MKTEENQFIEISEKELFSQIILDERDELLNARMRNPNRKKPNNKIRKMRG
jgi:hypothetical protein